MYLTHDYHLIYLRRKILLTAIKESVSGLGMKRPLISSLLMDWSGEETAIHKPGWLLNMM